MGDSGSVEVVGFLNLFVTNRSISDHQRSIHVLWSNIQTLIILLYCQHMAVRASKYFTYFCISF